MAKFKPCAVMAVHGIRTHAKWQKTFAEVLSARSIPCQLYDFGYYNIFRLLTSSSNERMVDLFYEWYGTIVNDKNLNIDLQKHKSRPSVVAHSFGSFIVGHALLKYEDMVFDKVILCGAILPEDFDWSAVMSRDQVNMVMNEFGLKDVWAERVGRFVSKAGGSGYRGFAYMSASMDQRRSELFRHSDYFKRQHIETFWLPFLQRPPSDLRVVHGREIDDEPQFLAILGQTGKIDKESFGNLPHFSEVALKTGLEWVVINPDIYTFLISRKDGRAKGYINAMPLEDGVFTRIKSGEIQDPDIQAGDILPFGSDQKVGLYLMSIATASDVRRPSQGIFQESLERLVNGLIDKLVYYAIYRNIRVTEIAAVGWTDAGRHLCKLLGMKQIKKDEFGNPIYCLAIDELSTSRPAFSGIRRLIEVYQKKP